ncbi:MAG: ribonuclease P protein component [Chitinophagaceae bacterium]
MAKQFTLGKHERLKSRKLIEQLFSKGQRMGLFPYRVFYLFEKDEQTAAKSKLQCGVGVSAKNFKKAVDRNRIKRLTREAWRLQKAGLDETMKAHSHTLSLFLIYTGKELPEFIIVKEKLALILQKLILIADENIAADA